MDNRLLGMVVGLKDGADNESVMTTAIDMMRGDLWKMKPFNPHACRRFRCIAAFHSM